MLLETLGPVSKTGDLAAGLAGENLQARIRGLILMAISNERGWLVLTTGNKSEMAVGYATLYGDMAGGYAVLKDVPKTLVYELCEHRNALAGTDLVPRAVIDKPPSAELRPDQRDDQSLPPYSVLDPILEGYVEQDLTVADLVVGGLRRRHGAPGHRPRRPRRVQAPSGAARPEGHEPGLRQGPAHADHEPLPGLGRYLGRARAAGFLNIFESARQLGALRAVELACFARLGERAPELSPAGCARWAASASRAHAWRAGLLEDLLPVSVGLPGPAELTVVPEGALADGPRAVPARRPGSARAASAAGRDSRTDNGSGLVRGLVGGPVPAHRGRVPARPGPVHPGLRRRRGPRHAKSGRRPRGAHGGGVRLL